MSIMSQDTSFKPQDRQDALEKLVPELELCKRIPKGAFAESALVWSRRPVYYKPHVWVIPRNHAAEVRDICPAPTLQEIMDALAKIGEPATMTQWESGNVGVCCFIRKQAEEEYSPNSAEAALKLWLIANSISSIPSIPSKKGDDAK